jgi:hypothetical protein
MMGDTIWIRVEGAAGDDDVDHSLMFDLREPLDALAAGLGVEPLSAFYDWADYEYNLSHEGEDESWVAAHARWHEGRPLLASLRAIRDAVVRDSAAIDLDEEAAGALVEELDDCIRKAQLATEAGRRIHLCVVM